MFYFINNQENFIKQKLAATFKLPDGQSLNIC